MRESKGLDTIPETNISIRGRSSDKMATHAKRPRRQFIDIYGDVVQNLQLKLLEYVRDLLGDPASTPIPPADRTMHQTTGKQAKRRVKELDFQDGFPVMPAVNSDDELKKGHLEDVIRAYLTAHYSKLGKPSHRIN
jgi:hypothetical protein